MADTAAAKKPPTELSATKTNIAPAATSGVRYTPRVDLYETNEEIVLQCDMPGVNAENIDLRFERGTLTLHGKVSPRSQPAQYVAAEYGIGDFHRSITIPVEIDATKLLAETKLGVLTVHLPKHERVKSQKITVKAG
jgi:HSP20 family protein